MDRLKHDHIESVNLANTSKTKGTKSKDHEVTKGVNQKKSI